MFSNIIRLIPDHEVDESNLCRIFDARILLHCFNPSIVF